MKYFFLYIFGLVCFIVVMAYWNSQVSNKEGFNPANQYFLLLGDSVLNNEVYVVNGKSVNQLLKDRTDGKTTCLAKNDANITSVYNQLQELPRNLKEASDKTTIFLSVGGNDILLSHDEDKEGGEVDSKVLQTIFSRYKPVVESIQMLMPKSQIVLLDLYQPAGSRFIPFVKAINEWNQLLYAFAKEKNLNVLRVSNILTTPEDFTHEIEPSALGSKKLVDNILSAY
jgi:hypothetical protein